MLSTDQYEFNNFSSIQKKIADLKKDNNLCYAIIIEPISASTLKNSDDEFLKKVRELCNRENIIL